MEKQRPPLPQVHPLPKATVEQWVQIPEHQYVNVEITRADLDNLYFSINNLVTSQASLQQALIAYSQGNLDLANEQMDGSQRQSIEAVSSLRALMSALMSSAIKNNKVTNGG